LQSGGTGNSQNFATIITANYKINNNKKITEIDNFYDAIYLFGSFGGKLATEFSLCAMNWQPCQKWEAESFLSEGTSV